MFKKTVLIDFETRKQDQLAGRDRGEFYPCHPTAFAASEKSYENSHLSVGFTSFVGGYRKRVDPIVYLHGSAKAMFLAYCVQDFHVSPSEVFDNISNEFLQIIDAALADLPSDLLVLLDRDKNPLHECSSAAEVLSAISDFEDSYHHSLVRLKARLLRQHVTALGASGFFAFRRAVLCLDAVQLFSEGELSPLALDFFPSLSNRAGALLDSRDRLSWRAETDEDPVVRL